MKAYVQFRQPLLSLRTCRGDALINIYPWIKHFYQKPGTDGTKPGHFYPVCGWIKSQVMDVGTCLTGETVIQFCKIDNDGTVIGTTGHTNIFDSKQFFDLTSEEVKQHGNV